MIKRGICAAQAVARDANQHAVEGVIFEDTQQAMIKRGIYAAEAVARDANQQAIEAVIFEDMQ